LDGGSRGEFLRSCISLLDVLGVAIPQRGNVEEEIYYSTIVQLVNGSLPRARRHSLLVVDNVEDPGLISNLRPAEGHILYTSRNSDWLNKIDVDVLKRKESIQLLLQLTGLSPDFSEQAEILAEELGDLPLALAQAAAYIKQQRLNTFAAYLEHYKVSQAELLAKKQIQSSLNKREAIVMTTWNTTMQKLSPQAQQLIHYFSYLAPTAIPTRLFQDLENHDVALNELMLYSMVKHLDDSVSIHRLVQLVTRLNTGEKVADILKYLLGSMKVQLLNDDDENTWSKSFTLTPHAEELLKYTLENQVSIVKGIDDIEDILQTLSWIYGAQSYYTASKNAFRSFLPHIETIHGSNSPAVLRAKFYLASAHGYLREYDESIRLGEEVLRAQELTLEKNDMKIAKSLHNLAVAYGWNGDYKTQVKMYERSLEICEVNIAQGKSEKNMDFVRIITNLANCYWYLGFFDKQKEMLEKLASIQDSGTLEAQSFIDNSWGLYYGGVGKFDLQKKYFALALEKRQRQYSDKHSVLTESLSRLGEACKNLGEYREAEELLKQALEQDRREDYRFRGTALKIRGDLYYAQGQFDLALEKFQEALAHQKEAFKENHPELAQILRRIGEVYVAQGKLIEARPFLTKGTLCKS
jgi:tetratricopeptide (TPR) repeat protein